MNDKLLELAAKPNRSTFQREVEQTKQRAYERSFKQTAKEIAQAEGAEAGAAAAAGTGGSALERARQRALGGGEPQAVNPVAKASVQPTKQPSQRIIQQPDGSRVPESFYGLSPEEQREFKRLVQEQENLASGETHFDRVSLGLVDQQTVQAQRITELQSQLMGAVRLIEKMQRRMDNIDTTVEVAKSEALEGQESSIAQMATNLLTIKLQASAEMEAYNRQREQAAAESREQLEAQATAIEALRGSVKSTTELMSERSNAVVSQLASMEGRVAQTEVKQTEIDNGIKANRDTLRAVTGDDLKSVVDLTVKDAFDNRLEPAMEDLIARKYVTTAPTTGLDGYDPKRDDSAKPFLTEQVGDDATARAVNRALKKGGRG